ncbi:MAG: GNAT family N-acetyltransferase [Hyphomicrobiales bacterium]|nr:GNAT family N-acetyltransferase [Hyphomicrobiales bacterium]
MTVRVLTNDDANDLRVFLRGYCETSMFLLSNLQSAGLKYADKAYHGVYLAAFDGCQNIVGVLVHYWNGNVMMQSPDIEILRRLVTQFKSVVKRSVTGVLGENVQAKFTIVQLGISSATFSTNRSERLYALDLTHLSLPEINQRTDVSIVDVNKIPASLLFAWIKAYNIEALGYTEGELLDVRSQAQSERLNEGSECWVLLSGGQPVCLSAFNARFEDTVQIGPVWTPEKFRNNGFARYLLANTLDNAIAQGIKKAILFTNEPSAKRAYKAIGFKPVGQYRLAILGQPMTIG